MVLLHRVHCTPPTKTPFDTLRSCISYLIIREISTVSYVVGNYHAGRNKKKRHQNREVDQHSGEHILTLYYSFKNQIFIAASLKTLVW